MLFAGLDVSTQSCKLVVIDYETKKTVFVHSVNYDADLPQYGTKNGVIENLGEGVSESDPNMWIEAVNLTFEKLAASDVAVSDIKAISVSGQQHGLVSLDKEGNLTRSRSKLWNDFSTQEECDLLTEAVGGVENMIMEVGNSQRTGYTAAKIFHMYRHEHSKYVKTDTFFLVHNYINWYLTGAKNRGVRIMEPGDTSGMALWNPVGGQWSQKVINAIDPGLMEKLPDIKPSEQSIGLISKELSEEYGFSRNCVVDAGCGDNMYGAIGTGNVVPGIVTISLGTSGTAYTFLEEPYVDSTGEIAAFCDSTGNYLPLLCVSNMANGYNTFIEKYNLSHEEFNALIEKTGAGNNGRILIPWFEGERTPDVPQAAPFYFGFKLEDFTPEALGRAVLEGHIQNLFYGFQRMPVKAREIRLTGGISQSQAWRQCIADIFNAETVPVAGEGAAIGAALHAAWVWLNENGRGESIENVTEPFVVLDEEKRCRPIAMNVQVYKEQSELFSALAQKLLNKESGDVFDIRNRMV